MLSDDFIDRAKDCIRQTDASSAVYVGCDSQRFRKKGKWYASYCRVILVHLAAKHGCKVFGNVSCLADYGGLKPRLLQEVMMACQLAMEVTDVLGERPLEVHLDINTNPRHRSSVAVKEAMGYVRGTLGIEPKLKPHSFAASSCADHFVR